ncbi:MAG: hypothetical protein IV086_06900 [Hyphomonadaceae bacterium]|nr:hypothetical protein [Hyphomonadaceae bacterium]
MDKNGRRARTWPELARYPEVVREIERASDTSTDAAHDPAEDILFHSLDQAQAAAISVIRADQAGVPPEEALAPLRNFGRGLRARSIGQIILSGGAELRVVFYSDIWALYLSGDPAGRRGALSAAANGVRPSEGLIRKLLAAWEDDAPAAARESDIIGARTSRNLADAYLRLNDVDGVRRVIRGAPEIADDYEAILAGRSGNWADAVAVIKRKWARQQGFGGAELDAEILTLLEQAAGHGGASEVVAYVDQAIAKGSAATELHKGVFAAMPRPQVQEMALRLERQALAGADDDGVATAAGSWAVAALMGLGERARAETVFERRFRSARAKRDAAPSNHSFTMEPEWAFVGMAAYLDRSADVSNMVNLSSVLLLERRAGRGMGRLPRILEGRWEGWQVSSQLKDCLAGFGPIPTLADAQHCVSALDRAFPSPPPLQPHELSSPFMLSNSFSFEIRDARLGYVAAAAQGGSFDLADAAFSRWATEVLGMPDAELSFSRAPQFLRAFAIADLRRQNRLR